MTSGSFCQGNFISTFSGFYINLKKYASKWKKQLHISNEHFNLLFDMPV